MMCLFDFSLGRACSTDVSLKGFDLVEVKYEL